MKTQFTDSDLRCPYDGKKLIVELGERGDGTDAGYEAVHRCWNCDYTEVETGRTVPLASTTGPILAHLRDPHAMHVRGCWALDLVLGKE